MENRFIMTPSYLDELVEVAILDHELMLHKKMTFEQFVKHMNLSNPYAIKTLEIIYNIPSYEHRKIALREYLTEVIRMQLGQSNGN